MNLIRPADRAWLEEVKRRLVELRPENPGRELTWPPAGLAGRGIVREGWTLTVVDIRGRPGDWWADVEVTIRTHDGRLEWIMVNGRHLERYRCVGGRCWLERESVAPEWNPDWRIIGVKM